MVIGHAIYDSSKVRGQLEIEDILGKFATFRRADRNWYSVDVPDNLDFPKQNLRVWHDSERKALYLVHDMVPTVPEIMNKERSLDEVPKDDYITHCNLIGRIYTHHGEDVWSHHHFLSPCFDKEILEDYVKECLFYFRLDAKFMPIMHALFRS